MYPHDHTDCKPSAPPPVMGVPVGSSSQALHHHHQYPQNASHQVHDGRWSTGLCDCGEDVPNCCITCWCPCITFGQIAEIVDEGTPSCGVSGAIYGLLLWFTGCGCLYSWIYRTKMRKTYMLEESPCNDCCVHWCCDACALCQEYRELQNRGFDMTIGWEGNMRRQNRGGVAVAPSAPVVEGGMTR